MTDTDAIREIVDDLATTFPGRRTLTPLHGVIDGAKVDRLEVDMLERGWGGPPVVADGEQAVTGSHRLAARKRAWSDHGADIEMPVVGISDLCEEFGIDWVDLVDKEVYLYEAVVAVVDRLPTDVVDYLGMDAH